MKTTRSLMLAALATVCGAALATEYGNVIASSAVMAQVPVAAQQCTDQPALVQPRTSGGGALVGALVGGILGHSLGDGFGRAAATGLGVVAGAAIGDRTEAGNTPPVAATARNCQVVTHFEHRLVGYDVTYEYQGRQYSARLPQDPGPRIALNVTVVPAGGAAAYAPYPPQAVIVAPPPVVYVQPPVVYAPPPEYSYNSYFGYYGGYGGPALTILPGVAIRGYGHYGRYGHWR